jgi:hypothetical protein
MEDTFSKSNGQPTPFTTSFRRASDFFSSDKYEDYLLRREKECSMFWGSAKQGREEIDKITRDAERARAKWACISAKSQRQKKKPSGLSYNLNIYDYLIQVKPVSEYSSIPKNPRAEGDQIHKFTKRSRQRMMNRARCLDKTKMKLNHPGRKKRVKVNQGVPDPYFVTLTYRKNFTDCERSKEHLNAFFQHFRRKSQKFAYVWKMEPQKRGAIHYHLCLFIPEKAKKQIREKNIKTAQKMGQNGMFLDLLRLEVQKVWARVTSDVDGFTVPLTEFKYIRKKAKEEVYEGDKVETVISKPKLTQRQIPDIYHELYGTNVREVDNWKMFMGYIYKYMNKEVEENPFKGDRLKGKIESFEGWENPPARYRPRIEIDRQPTGRFWGYSYNLCFDSLTEQMVSIKDEEALNDYCNLINNLAFDQFTQHLIDNLERERVKAEESGNWKLFYRKKRQYRETWKRQKRRHVYNRDKIANGRAFSVEFYHAEACRNLKFLPTINASKYFGNPPHPKAC